MAFQPTGQKLQRTILTDSHRPGISAVPPLNSCGRMFTVALILLGCTERYYFNIVNAILFRGIPSSPLLGV
jgi:hypothetical protein